MSNGRRYNVIEQHLHAALVRMVYVRELIKETEETLERYIELCDKNDVIMEEINSDTTSGKKSSI